MKARFKKQDYCFNDAVVGEIIIPNKGQAFDVAMKAAAQVKIKREEEMRQQALQRAAEAEKQQLEAQLRIDQDTPGTAAHLIKSGREERLEAELKVCQQQIKQLQNKIASDPDFERQNEMNAAIIKAQETQMRWSSFIDDYERRLNEKFERMQALDADVTAKMKACEQLMASTVGSARSLNSLVNMQQDSLQSLHKSREQLFPQPTVDPPIVSDVNGPVGSGEGADGRGAALHLSTQPEQTAEQEE